jgi:hypothetical protein
MTLWVTENREPAVVGEDKQSAARCRTGPRGVTMFYVWCMVYGIYVVCDAVIAFAHIAHCTPAAGAGCFLFWPRAVSLCVGWLFRVVHRTTKE